MAPSTYLTNRRKNTVKTLTSKSHCILLPGNGVFLGGSKRTAIIMGVTREVTGCSEGKQILAKQEKGICHYTPGSSKYI